MSNGVNKVILVGNLGQDPEVRYMPNGNAVTNMTIATTESWNDKQTGERQDKTEWHRVVMFRKLAEIAGEYLKKGSQVYIEGKLQTRKWQDNSGNDRYTTEIVANEMQMLGGRAGGGQYQNQGQSNQSQSNQNQSGGGAFDKQSSSASAQKQDDAPSGPSDFDDDIPF